VSIPGRTSLGAGCLVCLPDGKSYLVGAVPLTIGREPSSNVPVHSKEASRTHAYILRTPQGFLLVDSSLHGTYVNTERVQAQRILTDGDVVQIGGHSFRFDLRSAEADPAGPGPNT
jgi:pSer/pThr/pTyr-binding forkhead associated (FHA) protein